MNMMKKNGGFTLVELIVVIAILAILAGVAVPAYSGYMTKARDAAVLTELDAVKTAAFAANATDPDGVKSIQVTTSAITVNGESATLSPYYTGSVTSKLSNTSYASGAYWTPTSNGWQAGTVPAGS